MDYDRFRFWYLRSLRFGESYVYAATALVEVYAAFFKGEDGVVFADTYVFTGLPFCSALADDDVTWDDDFATKFFNAESFAA